MKYVIMAVLSALVGLNLSFVLYIGIERIAEYPDGVVLANLATTYIMWKLQESDIEEYFNRDFF